MQALKDLMIAGTETSTSTIRWGILCLIHYPNTQIRLRQEIHKAIGKKRVWKQF